MTVTRQTAAGLAHLAVAAVILALVLVGNARAALPGANGKIAFETGRTGNSEIFVMNADGGNQTNVSNDSATDQEPAFSADGSKIAFASSRSGNSEVFVMNADGSGQVNRSNNPAIDSSPSFSPDGSKIVFRSNRDAGNSEIYVMNSDGTGQTRLTTTADGESRPSFSPDGTKIVFQNESQDDVFVMNANGSSPVNVSGNVGNNTSPAFSPDGSKVVFQSNRDGNQEIYVVSADGQGLQTNLTNNMASDTRPDFSPDGSTVIFQSGRDANNEIYVMKADGTGQTNLTNASSSEAAPNWQPVVDADSDGVLDPGDNCKGTANADQADLDGDGAGDACDADDDADGISDTVEGQTGTNPHAADSDGDGKPDGADACPTLAATTANGCPVIVQPPPVITALSFTVTGVSSKISRKNLIAKGIRPSVTPNRAVAFRFELRAPITRLRAASAGDLVISERSLARAAGKRSALLAIGRRLRGAVHKGTKLRLLITATDANGTTKVVTRRIAVR
jgi:hypothetical protein